MERVLIKINGKQFSPLLVNFEANRESWLSKGELVSDEELAATLEEEKPQKKKSTPKETEGK